MRLDQLGEKAFLANLLSSLNPSQALVNGFGHDASVIDMGLAKHVAFKIDRAPYPLATKRGWVDFRLWGRLAIVANASDLLCTGAIPCAFLISLVLPRSFLAEDAQDIVLGATEACEELGFTFAGGDTKEGPSPQVIGAGIGTTDRDYYLGRTGAKPGDKLIIAGKLGGFLAALDLADSLAVNHPDFPDWLRVLSSPSPRMDEAIAIRTHRFARCGTDLSDGLADAIRSFCSPEVGVEVYEDLLPIHELVAKAVELALRGSVDYAFSVGDWAIAYAVPPHRLAELQTKAAAESLCLCVVGEFKGEPAQVLVDHHGAKRALPCIANEHFAVRVEDR